MSNILDLSRAEGNILIPDSIIRAAIPDSYDLAILPNKDLYCELRKKIAEKYEVHSASVVLCNGSDEAIEDIARMHQGGSALTIVPCFERLYEVNNKYNINLSTYCMSPATYPQSQQTDLVAIGRTISEENPDLVWICNPCNPTGVYIGVDDIQFLAFKHKETTFVIDEAFIDVTMESASCAKLAEANPNIIVINSFSKSYGMSSCRVGFLVASQEIAGVLESAHTMYNVNGFGLRLALAALNWGGIKDEYRAIKSRRAMAQAFIETKLMDTYTLINAHTSINMWCLRHRTLTAQQLADRLLAHGVKVKTLDNMKGLEGAGYCRVLVPRSDEDLATLLGALEGAK